MPQTVRIVHWAPCSDRDDFEACMEISQQEDEQALISQALEDAHHQGQLATNLAPEPNVSRAFQPADLLMSVSQDALLNPALVPEISSDHGFDDPIPLEGTQPMKVTEIAQVTSLTAGPGTQLRKKGIEYTMLEIGRAHV